MINEKRIQYMLMVAEEQNITSAARKLFVSQPALSRMILDIEQELGLPLFIRDRGAVRPTQAGEVYLRGCREVLAIDRAVKREISDLRSSRRGKITLAVTALTGEFLLPRILSDFEAAYPGVQLELLEARTLVLSELVKSGKADLALVRKQETSELSYERVMENPVYLQLPPFYVEACGGVARAQLHDEAARSQMTDAEPETEDGRQIHGLSRPAQVATETGDGQMEGGVEPSPARCSFRPGTGNPSISPQVLNGQPVVLLKEGRGLREETDRLFLQYGITPSKIVETENIHLAHQLVNLNKGFTFIPDFAVHDFFHDDAESIYRQLDGYTMTRPLYACYARNRYLTAAERHLIELIAAL